jgi:hypothetical protein
VEGGGEREQPRRFFTRWIELLRLEAEAEKQIAGKKTIGENGNGQQRVSGLSCWHFVRFEQVSRFTGIRSVPVPDRVFFVTWYRL